MTGAIESADNVTTIRGKKRTRVGMDARVDKMLERLGEIMSSQVRTALPSLLDEADDRLYELAERASSNQLQTHYFEAMRKMRVARRDIAKRFLTELDSSVQRRLGASDDAGVQTGDSADLESSVFKLVEQDEFEETVAVKNISGKLRNLCQEELFSLDRRVAFLLSDPEVEGAENPFAPECLANAANSALHEIDLSLEVRLMLLKLVDRHLVRGAQVAYQQMNRFLIDNGVLTDIRPKVSPSRGGGAHGRGQSTQGQWVQAAATQMGVDQSADNGLGSPVAPHGIAPSGIEQVIPSGPRSEQLVAMLGDILSVSSARTMNHDLSVTDANQLIGGFTELQRAQSEAEPTANLLRDIGSLPAADNLNSVDALLIDVVAMMFDYVLDDENIVEGVRALIARLQIPMLKVAILDKTFFARRTHPARQFVNSLAELGARMGDSVGAGDPVFDRLEELVRQLLAEFESDLDVFPRALAELESIATQEVEAAEENAWQESKIAEERERLERCREQAASEVETRIECDAPPQTLVDFLREHWRHLLANALYQHGGESKQWRAAVQTMDNLIWSATPKSVPEERDRLLAMLPFLLQRLKSGMEELCLPKAMRDAFLKSLSRFHIEAIKPPEERSCDAEVAEPAAEEEPPTLDPQALPEPVELEPPTQRGARECLLLSIEKANRMVYETAESRIQCRGMGTTVVAVKLDSAQIVYAHVGDSRLYRLRGRELEQLTKDHTYRQQMLDRGLCDESNAHKVAGNLITRAVGIEDQVMVDVDAADIAVGDLFLLCSDGLSDMIDDATISRLIRRRLKAGASLDDICESLVDAANEAGGRDNITAALARIDAVPGATIGHMVDHSAFMSTAMATDSGRVRPHNEDCVEHSPELGLVVLADGMGGCNAGEVASAMTVKVMIDHYLDAVEASMADAADDGEFDFSAINATFWDEGLSGDDRQRFYDAVADEVESISASGIDALDDAFNIDGGADAPPPAKDATTPSDPFLSKILGLSEGCWVEFRSGDADNPRAVRASLTWVASDKSRYLFTGRLGQKVADATPHSLALELRNERMRVLDAVPLFDRAINNLSSRLRTAGAQAEAELA